MSKKNEVLIYEDQDFALTEDFVQWEEKRMIILKGKGTKNFVDISSDGYFSLQVGFSKGTLTRISKKWLDYLDKDEKCLKLKY